MGRAARGEKHSMMSIFCFILVLFHFHLHCCYCCFVYVSFFFISVSSVSAFVFLKSMGIQISSHKNTKVAIFPVGSKSTQTGLVKQGINLLL